MRRTPPARAPAGGEVGDTGLTRRGPELGGRGARGSAARSRAAASASARSGSSRTQIAIPRLSGHQPRGKRSHFQIRRFRYGFPSYSHQLILSSSFFPRGHVASRRRGGVKTGRGAAPRGRGGRLPRSRL